ncbi:hypothetical protein Tco_0810263 [Tanacetum coccineum]
MKHSYSNDDTCFSIDVIDEILEEYFDALLNEGSKILYSIKGTPFKDQIFTEFDEFMAMNIEENSESESDKEEIPFEKITFDTDYKIKKSLDEPPTDLELKLLPDHMEYAFLEEPSFLPVIISSQLSEQNKNKLVFVLKKHKQAFAWKTTGIPEGIVLGHKVSGAGLEVEKAKIDVISKLPPLTNAKGIGKCDIEIKDKKGAENVAADHFSRIENDETSEDKEIDDNFPGETLMEISTRDIPWLADFGNYLVGFHTPPRRKHEA